MTRVAVVVDRVTGEGGSDRYLEELVDVVDGDVHVLHGGICRGPLRERLAGQARVRGLGDQMATDRSWDGLTARLARIDPARVLVQNVMAPGALAALAGPGATLIVQDHRIFCPARGKVLSSGSPCADPMGAVCAACFDGPDGHDQARFRRLAAVTEARLQAALEFPEVVVLSTYMARELAQMGFARDRVRVVPPPVSRWSRSTPVVEKGAALARPRVVVPGRISWHKGSRVFLDAAGELDAELVFAGDGPDRPWVEARGQEVAASVEVTGWLSDVDLLVAMSSADVVCLPSLWAEPFGIAGLEAIALGRPVVAFDVGGVRSWLEPGLGLLVPPNSAPDLSASLVAAVGMSLDPGARRRILDRFSVEAFAAAWGERLAETVG